MHCQNTWSNEDNQFTSFVILTVTAKQLARTQRDKKRPLLQVETPPREVLEALADERNPLYEEIADVTIRTDDQSAKVVANQIIHMLESN